MKINRLIGTLVIAASVAIGAVAVTGCKDSGGEQAKKYTCTHHPEVVQDTPGTCPKCNMALVEKK
jgi:Cu(I)/Ag(I) efflux system membrane fusion protein